MTNKEEYTFEIMAKSCGPLCNLDCVYCFYKYKPKWVRFFIQLDDEQ